MPRFEYWFVNPSTGRRNKRGAKAFDEACLREDLAEQGIEPTEIIALPDRPASEAQLDYMCSLGVMAPPDVTLAEASDLLDNRLRRREPADPRDFEIARKLRVEVSRFASKAGIHRAILFDLSQRGGDEMLGAWFAYRVYRNAYDRALPGIDDPLDPRFIEIGTSIATDAKLMASLRRAVAASTVHFRWFGIFRAPDGPELQGDGDRSAVYKFTLSALGDAGLLRPATVRRRGGYSGEAPAKVRQRPAFPAGGRRVSGPVCRNCGVAVSPHAERCPSCKARLELVAPTGPVLILKGPIAPASPKSGCRHPAIFFGVIAAAVLVLIWLS